MKLFFVLVFFVSCAQVPPKRGEELVSVNAALNHAEASYLKGCVEAHRNLRIPVAYPRCRDKAALHRQELNAYMEVEEQ